MMLGSNSNSNSNSNTNSNSNSITSPSTADSGSGGGVVMNKEHPQAQAARVLRTSARNKQLQQQPSSKKPRLEQQQQQQQQQQQLHLAEEQDEAEILLDKENSVASSDSSNDRLQSNKNHTTAAPPPSKKQSQKQSKKQAQPQQQQQQQLHQGKEDDNGDGGNALFEALSSAAGVSVESLVSDWVDDYQETDSLKAMTDLINFILQSCGCPGRIDEDTIQDQDIVTESLEDLQNQFDLEAQEDYPLISKGSSSGRRAAGGINPFRKNFTEFWKRWFAKIRQHDILYNTESGGSGGGSSSSSQVNPTALCLDVVKVWLVAMSSSSFRPFRHTSTYVSLLLMTSLCETTKSISTETHLIRRQLAAEMKKSGGGGGRGSVARKLTDRARALENGLEVLTGKKSKLDTHMTEFFNAVFVHRYRDFDPCIRSECIKELGVWIYTLPEVYLDPQYMRYVGWMLSDKESRVRLESLKCLGKLFASDTNSTGLHQFIERFKTRLAEMARGEREAPLRRAAIDIMVNAAENGLIEDEDRDTIIPILFMQDASTTAAAAEGSARDVVARFFGDMFKEEIREAREREEDEKADQAGGDSREENQQEWLDLKHLAASLYKYSCMTEELVGDPRLSVTSSSATKESSTACLTKQDVLALLTRPLSQDLSTAASLIGDDEHTRGGGADETMISMDQAIEEVVSKWTLMDTVVRSKARLQLVQSAVSAATTDDSAWCAYDMVQDSASTQTESSSSSNTKESLHAGVGPLRIKAAVEALWGHVDVLKKWKSLIDYISQDLSEDSMYALTDKEETVLLFILSAIVQLVNDGSVQIEHSATTAATPKRRASTAVSAGGQGGNFMTTEEAVLAISRELLSLLPKLLLKFGAEYSSGLGQINLVTSLELIPFLDLGIYVDTRMTKAFDSMFNDIKSLFLKHSSKDVIEKCVLSLVHLKGVKEDSEDQEGEDGEEDTAAGTSSISTTPARRGGKTVKGMKSKKKKTSLSFNSSNDNITATGPSTLADLHDSVMLKLYSLAEATLTELDELQIDLKASVNESIESSQEFAEIVIDLDVRNVSLVTASVQRLFSLYRFIDMTDCKSSRQRDEPDISSSSSSNEEEDESSVFSIINAVLDSVLSLNKLIAPLTTPTASTSSEAASLSTKNLKKAWSVKLVLEDTLEMCFGVLFIDMIQEVHHAGGKQQSGNEGEVAARNASGDYAAAAVAASSATLSSHLERFKEKSDHLSKVMEAIVVGPYDWDLTDKADAESDFSPFSVNVKLAAMNVLTDLFCVCNGPLSLNFPSIARRAPSDLQLGSARLMSTCLDLLCFSEPSMDVISAAPLQPSQSPSLPLMSLEKRGALGHRLLKMCAKMWKLPQLAVFSPAHLSTLLACMGIKSPSSGDVVYGARLLAEIEQQPTADAMRGVSLNVFGTMWDKITTAIGQDVVAHLWDTIMFDHTGLGASKDCDEQEDAELMLMDEEGNIGQQQNAKARRQQIEKSLRDFSRLVFNSLEQAQLLYLSGRVSSIESSLQLCSFIVQQMTNSLIVEKKANPALTDTLKNQIASKLLDVLNDGTGLMIKLLRTWRRKRRQEKADRRQLRRQQLRDSNEIGDSLEDVEDEDDDDDDDDEEIPKDTRKELGTGGEEVWGKFVMSCANLEEVNACWKVWGAFGGAVQHLMQLFKTKATRTSCGYTNVNEISSNVIEQLQNLEFELSENDPEWNELYKFVNACAKGDLALSGIGKRAGGRKPLASTIAKKAAAAAAKVAKAEKAAASKKGGRKASGKRKHVEEEGDVDNEQDDEDDDGGGFFIKAVSASSSSSSQTRRRSDRRSTNAKAKYAEESDDEAAAEEEGEEEEQQQQHQQQQDSRASSKRPIEESEDEDGSDEEERQNEEEDDDEDGFVSSPEVPTRKRMRF